MGGSTEDGIGEIHWGGGKKNQQGLPWLRTTNRFHKSCVPFSLPDSKATQ